jgi:flagellar basal-body rod protein FlgF
MKLYGGIDLNEGGMIASIRDMYLQTDLMNVINDNIQGFNKVGYQRKVPVVSSFAEFLGPNALSQNVDEQVGRIKITKNPLDLALATEGYFQVQTPNGIQLTRDGRFQLDKNGNLLTIQNYKVLSKEGQPVKLSNVPKELEDIKIEKDGSINYLDRSSLKLRNAGTLSVVSSKGKLLENPDVKQGYVEESNVAIHEELFNLVPVRRNFEANRQLFLIQSDAMTKLIQELGRAT